MTNPITVRALCKICMQEQFHDQKYDPLKLPMWMAAIERAISSRLKRELTAAGDVSYKVKSAICEKGQPMPKHTFVQGEILTTYECDSLTCYCWVFLLTSSPPKTSKGPEATPVQAVTSSMIAVPPQRQSPVESLQEVSVSESEDSIAVVPEPEPEPEVEPEPSNEEGSSFWFNPLSVVPAVTIPTISPNPLSWFSGIGGTTEAEPVLSSSNSTITMTAQEQEEEHEQTEKTEMEQVATSMNQSEMTSSRSDESKAGRPKGKTRPVWDIRIAETTTTTASVKNGQFVLSGSADDDPSIPAGAAVALAPEKKPAKKWPTVQTGASRALPTKPGSAVSTPPPSDNNMADLSGLPTSSTAEEKVEQPLAAAVAIITEASMTVTGAEAAMKITKEEGGTGGKDVSVPPSPALSTVSGHDAYLVTESDWLKSTPLSASAGASGAAKQPSPLDHIASPLPLSGSYYPGGSLPGHPLGSPAPGGDGRHFAALTSPAAPGEQWPPRPIVELYPAHTLTHPYDLYEHSLLNPSESASSTNSTSASARASPTYFQPFQLQHTVLPPSNLPDVYANPAYEHLQANYRSNPQSNPPATLQSNHITPTYSAYDHRPVSSSSLPSLGLPALPAVPLKTTRWLIYNLPCS